MGALESIGLPLGLLTVSAGNLDFNLRPKSLNLMDRWHVGSERERERGRERGGEHIEKEKSSIEELTTKMCDNKRRRLIGQTRPPVTAARNAQF